MTTEPSHAASPSSRSRRVHSINFEPVIDDWLEVVVQLLKQAGLPKAGRSEVVRVALSFDELCKHAIEGHDFRIRTVTRPGQIAVIAPHGGGIEPGTSELAEAIAGTAFSFYAFEARMTALLHLSKP